MADDIVASEKVREYLEGDAQALHHVMRGDLHAACMIRAAKAAGIARETVELPAGIEPACPWLRLNFPDKTAYFRTGAILVGPPGASLDECRLLNGNAAALIDDKRACKELFRILGFPTPAGITLGPDDEEKAVAWFNTIGKPVCLKANGLGQGTDVYPALDDISAVRDAFRRVFSRNRDGLIEEHCPGQAVRFLYLRPKVIAVRMDLPANVIGDGVSDIAMLIEAKNAEKTRRTGHKPILVDDDVTTHLRRLGLSLHDVLETGRRIFLRSVSNGSKGGDSMECRRLVHPSYIQAIEQLCGLIHDLRITAVDTKLLDPVQPANVGNYHILEVNNRPGLVPFHFPWEGEAQDVAMPIIQALQSTYWYRT